MAEGIPDLIIPIRMEIDKALKALTKIAGGGKKAGDDVAAGAKKGKAELDDLGGSANSAAESLVSMVNGHIALSVPKSVGSAIGEEFKRSADYVKQKAAEFAELREAMQQVSALKNQQNTDQFVLSEVEKANKAGLTPTKWREFQEQFQSYGGAQNEGPDAKLNPEQAEEYQQKIAAFMTARGVAPAQGAQLGGALLTNAKGPQGVDKLMAQFGRVYQTLEKAQTPVPDLLPKFQEVIATGLLPEEAAQALAIVAPASPGEESTSVVAAATMIRKMKIAGTGEEYGVKEGMGRLESMRAFAEHIEAKRQSMIAGGKTGLEAEDVIAEELDEKDLVNDVREARKLVSGFAKYGVELGGFQTFKRYAEETPDTFTEDETRAAQNTTAGRKRQRLADQARADAIKSEKYSEVAAVLERATVKETEEGEPESSQFWHYAAKPIEWWSQVDSVQRSINARAIEDVKQTGRDLYRGARPEVAPSDMPSRAQTSSPLLKASGHGIKSQVAVNEEILAVLKVIETHTGKNAAAVLDATKKPGRPLDAKPAGGDNKRQ